MLKPPKPSESPTFIHNKAINSLEKYIDYELEDNCSFLSDEQTCSVDEENAKPSSFARKLSGWTDVITKTLIRQRPKRHIDNQDQSQFVSREESEHRLLLLFLTFSLITCLITTGLLIACPFYCINKDIITLYPRQQPILKVPHILVIYQDGRMSDYSTNEILSPSRNVSMKLTCSNVYKKLYHGSLTVPNRSCYVFAYADLKHMHIFYGNAKRDMTFIDTETFDYGTMSGTKLKEAHIEGIAAKVGDKFIVLGGIDYKEMSKLSSKHISLFHHNTPMEWIIMQAKATIWSDRKQDFIGRHPDFFAAKVDYSCITGFNRTHFLIVNKPFSNGEVSMVGIDTWTETVMPRIPLPNPDSRVTCEVEFSKESLRLIAISKMHDNLDEISSMYQYNFQTEEWSQSNTNLKYFGTLRIVNGIKYFFNILNPERHFGYFYDSKDDTWIKLSIPGYFGEELENKWKQLENVIAVSYYA